MNEPDYDDEEFPPDTTVYLPNNKYDADERAVDIRHRIEDQQDRMKEREKWAI